VSAAGRRPSAVNDNNPDTWWSPGSGVARAVLELRFPAPVRANVLRLDEAIVHGQSVERFGVDVASGGSWRTVATGTTIGYARLARFDPSSVEAVRVTVESTLDEIRISRVALFLDGSPPAPGGRPTAS
jgi:alpha-L-fucosidase